MRQILLVFPLLLACTLTPAVSRAQISEFAEPIFQNDRQTLRALETKITVDYRYLPLESVLKDLTAKLDIQILLHESLEDNNVEPDSEISLALREVRGCTVLNLLLEPWQSTYWIRDGVLLIGSRDASFDHLSREVFELPDSRFEMEQLRGVIQEIVDCDSWEQNGGFARLQIIGERLVIRQTQKNLREIRDLLVALDTLAADGIRTD